MRAYGILAICALLMATGCRSARYTYRPVVDQDISARTGHAIGHHDDGAVMPSGVSGEDGLDETEAVQIALWNNPGFRQGLAELGVASAREFDADLLPDPEMTVFLPLGPKQLEFTIFQSIAATWVRPARKQAAAWDAQQTRLRVTQLGLDLIRDVRIAQANLVLAQQQLDLAREAKKLRSKVAELTEKRVKAGGISKLEGTAADVDNVNADVLLRRAEREVAAARARFAGVLGMSGQQFTDAVNPSAVASGPLPDVESLVATAMSSRPDVQSASAGVDAACARWGLSRRQFMNLDAIFDANSRGRRGFEAGPGLRLTIPLWNRNRGGIAIAEAELRRARAIFQDAQNRAAMEVRDAYARVRQAQDNIHDLREKLLPKLTEAAELAERNFRLGGASMIFALQATDRYLQARGQQITVEADLRRTFAELERNVGHQVPVENPALPPPIDPPKLQPAPPVREEAANPRLPQVPAVRNAGFDRAVDADDERWMLPIRQGEGQRREAVQGREVPE